MKKPLPRLPSLIHRATPVALLLLSAVTPIIAADKTWDGEGANDFWATGANWDPSGGGGTAPAANDFLFFDGNTRLTPNNNFTAGTPFRNLTFNGGASSFTLGGNVLSLTAPPAANYTGGLNATYLGGSISNASPNTQTISMSLILSNGHHYIIGNVGGGSLNLSGPITLGNAASATFTTGINVTGSGLTTVNGILGGWATMNGPTTWATLDESGNVIAYTDFTDVGAGNAISTAAASNVRIPDSGANVTLAAAGVTDINSLLFGSGATAAQTIDVAAGRTLRFGTKGGIFNVSREVTGTSRILTIGTATGTGAITAGGADGVPGDLYLIETPFVGNSGNQVVINSRITNNGTAAVTVHTFGHISYPNVNHGYSGGTYIHGGRIQVLPNTLGTGPITIYPGGQLFFNNNGTCTNAIFMAGFGNAETSGNGAIRMGGAGRIITGVVTLMADAATANGTFNGRITGPGNLVVGSGTGNGVGTMIIGATNDYSGDTIINGTNANGASSLQMTTGRPHTMPHGAGKGNLIMNGATVVATFNLNGTDQTINGLTSLGASANSIINSGAGGNVTLTLGDNNASGTFNGIIQNGSGIAVTKIGTGTQTLSGANTYTNATTVNGGTLIFGPGGAIAASSPLVVNNAATLNVADICPVTFSGTQSVTSSNGTIIVDLQSSGNAITTPTLNANGSTNFIKVAAIPAISTYPAQFVAIKYTALGGALNFGLAGPLPVSPGTPYAAFVSNNVANGSVDVVITAGPASLRWSGYSSGSPNSSWDTSTPNWVTLGGAPATYSDGSFANFFDFASNGIVTLNQQVFPAGITVSNNSLAYTFNGAQISGGGGLSKQGPGSLILDNAPNDFTGDVGISGGTLQIGNNNGNGTLPVTATILDNASLTFVRSDSLTVSNLITGTGTVTQNGSGSLTLAAANTFTGIVTVAQGTLQLANSAALGTTNGGTVVANGATLDISLNAINIGSELVTASGNGVSSGGAVVNNSGSAAFVAANMSRLTLAGNTSVGGSGRLDLRSNPTSNPGLASLNTGALPRKLTKVGSGQFSIVGVTVDAALGDVEVQQGILGLEAATTGLGNVNSNLVVLPGATLEFFALTNQLNKVITIGGDGATASVLVNSGANTIVGPMKLTNDCIFTVANGAGFALTLSNVLTGDGLIHKAVGTNTIFINGNSPNFAGGINLAIGNIVVGGTLSNGLGVAMSGGRFVLNGSLLGAGITNTTGTVAGSGTATGAADIFGSLFPGETNSIGTLTLGPTIIESGANLFYDLAFDTTAGSGSNDLLVVNGNLTVNSANITINPVGVLKTGVPYRLINYTGSLIWNGDLSVGGINNYTFTINTNTPGQINLVASGGPPVWNGGSATANNWSDPANWNGLAIQPNDSLYFAGTTRLNNTNDTTADTTYTDLSFVLGAGAFTLNGNSINLGGNINNSSTNAQTVNLNMSMGGNRGFNGNSAALNITGGITNTVNLNTLTLGGTGSLANIIMPATGLETNTIATITTNTSWTLLDNASSTALTNPIMFDIQAGGFNFGTGSSAPKLTSSTLLNSRLGVLPSAPATFNMVSGSLTIAARLNTGAAGNCISTVNQSGGTINIMDVFQGADGAATALSTVNVSGGVFNVGEAEDSPNTFFLCSRGTGVLTMTVSGTVRCGTLDMSRNASSASTVGIVNLNGGSLEVQRVATATSAAGATGTPTATFNFNGGTLKARQSRVDFFIGNAASPAIPITSIVKSGGAFIDTTNFNVSIQEPLQHDTTLGATPDGGLVKKGTGTLTLTASSTYTGPTTISNGTLLVNGTLTASAVTVTTNGTLGGTGTCGTTLTVQQGGTVSPGITVGTLSIGGAITLGGTTLMEINPAANTNDLLRSTSSSVTYGGTLVVTNIGGALAGGSSFKLFNSSINSYLSSFTSIQLPGLSPGQSWNTSQLGTSGTISVVGTIVPPSITSVSTGSGIFTVSGNNGVTNGAYRLIASTNVALPLSTWTVVALGQFDGNGNFSSNVAIDPSMPQRFFAVRIP